MSGHFNGPVTASLKYDPFLTRLGDPGTGDLKSKTSGSQIGEGHRLVGDNIARRGGGEAKLMILPTACCMLSTTLVSVLALAISFNESGHQDGYEEGRLDSDDASSGCEVLYYWLLVQACVDLGITCLACTFIWMPAMKAEPVGVHGCCATVRLCTLAAGFHILYFSGLKREMCDSFLIIWATILIWLGVGIMVMLAIILACLLLGAVGSPQLHQPTRPPPRRNGAKPPPYETMPKR